KAPDKLTHHVTLCPPGHRALLVDGVDCGGNCGPAGKHTLIREPCCSATERTSDERRKRKRFEPCARIIWWPLGFSAVFREPLIELKRAKAKTRLNIGIVIRQSGQSSR